VFLPDFDRGCAAIFAADTDVVGHVDATGADAYNPALSSRRA